MKNNKVVFIVIIVILALAGVAAWFSTQKNDGAKNDQQSSISIEGETVCLLHKDMDGPHTLECAIGLKTDDGTYYGLGGGDTSLSSVNKRVRVHGTLKKESSPTYQSEGTITVTSYDSLD